jgi:hypothetical protein
MSEYQQLQSVVFSKKYWSLAEARHWVHQHGYHTVVDITPTQYRFRQEQPIFNHYITKKIKYGNKPINLIIGFI